MSKTVFILVLIMLAGCGDAGKQEKQARAEAQRRESADVAQAQAQRRQVALDHAQVERERREFWQGLAYFASAASVVLLIVGVAMGSATIRKAKGGPNGTNR